MKKLSFITAAAAIAFAGAASAATDVPSSFNVQVTVVPMCVVSSPATDIAFPSYTAFTATAVTASSSVTFHCSRGVAPQVRFDNANGTTSNAGTGAPTAEGVLQGLRYTLAAGAVTAVAGTTATAGAGGTGGSNGTADSYTFNITATLPAGQAGATTGSSNHSRSIILSF